METIQKSQNLDEIAVEKVKKHIRKVVDFIKTTDLPQSEVVNDWFDYLVKFKEELGNFNNDLSLLSTIMAKTYLVAHFDLPPFDISEKAQGAPGLDIDIKTLRDERIIAEIKTTHPFLPDDLGAQQAKAFIADADKLHREEAHYKYFFVTDAAAFEVLKKNKYRLLFTEIKVVLLPSGMELTDQSLDNRPESYMKEGEIMESSNFDEIWLKISGHLVPGTSIRNWTALKGYLGDQMTIMDVEEERIVIKAPNAQKPVNVPKKDFEAVWKIWSEYKAGKVQRQEITEFSFFSKYVISILHWMEQNKKSAH